MSTPQLLIGISGFGARLVKHTGIEDLVLRASVEIPSLISMRYHWNDCLDAMLGTVHRDRYLRPSTEINIVAHSYGGSTATALAYELAECDFKVKRVFLSDPVWRPWLYWPSVLSCFSRGEIEVPMNVENLWVWRQSVDRIQGARIYRQSSNTKFHVDKMVNKRHREMDNHQPFHDTVIEELQ